jgi:hypothetical protein
MKKKILVILTIFLCAAIYAEAQDVYTSSGSSNKKNWTKQEPKGFDPQRLIFGGGLGLSFGTVTSIAVAPIIGYRITENFSAGIGLNYQYLLERDAIPLLGRYYDYEASMLAPSVWMRYVIFSNLFVQAVYEHNFIAYTNYRYDQNGSGNIESYKEKYSCPSVLLGGGYRQPVSENASMLVMILYDVIQDPLSPYYRRLDFRFGFAVGF